MPTPQPSPSLSDIVQLSPPSVVHLPKKGTRLLSNWMESYLEYTSDIPAPHALHLWSGITAISGALSRKVWLRTNTRMPALFPNLYVLLVAPPGVGKDLAINTAADIIRDADTIAREAGGAVIRLGGESISPKGLIDKLSQDASKQHIKWTYNGEHHAADIHSLMLCIGELGTVMAEYDTKLVPILNDLYNCKSNLEDTIRGSEVSVKNPHLTLLLGNQPQTLAEVIPERNFRMGFTSRIILVYEDKVNRADMYIPDNKEGEKKSEDMRKALVHDLVEIAKMAGQFTVSTDTQQAVNEFNKERPGEVPGSRFLDYNTRRPLHVQKLALCLAAAESSRKTVEIRHWATAFKMLTDVEERMPSIFENVTSARGFSETHADIIRYGKEGKLMTMSELVERLSKNHAPHEVNNILNLMRSAGTLEDAKAPDGRALYPPQVRVR